MALDISEYLTDSALSLGSGFAGNIAGNIDNDRLDKAIEHLTTESYSTIYGVIDDI